MVIARSFWRKAIVTVVAAGGFAFLLEATILDSQYAALQSVLHETSALPAPGARLAFTATAYCKGITTASGVPAQRGVLAADPEVLPVGTVVQIDTLEERYNGIYTVMDTGPAVQGRQVDLYMWSCYEALDFGRRSIRLTVLRLGWNPRATTPSFLNRLFKKPGQEPLPPLPARPLPLLPPLDATP